MTALTAPQLAALRHFAQSDAERNRAGWTPRIDVIGRLAALGLVRTRTAWVHNGLTYRSRQRLAVVDVYVTDTGRAVLNAPS
jgi:hypothetical protein